MERLKLELEPQKEKPKKINKPETKEKVKGDIELNKKTGIILGILTLVSIVLNALMFTVGNFHPWLSVTLSSDFWHAIVSGLLLFVVTISYIPPICLLILIADKIPSKTKIDKKTNETKVVRPFYASLITTIPYLGVIGLFIFFYFTRFTSGIIVKVNFLSGILCVLAALASAGALIYFTLNLIERETKASVAGGFIMLAVNAVFYVIYLWWWVVFILVVLGGIAIAYAQAPKTKVVHHYH